MYSERDYTYMCACVETYIKLNEDFKYKTCLRKPGSEAVYPFHYYFRREHSQKLKTNGMRVILLISVLLKSNSLLTNKC